MVAMVFLVHPAAQDRERQDGEEGLGRAETGACAASRSLAFKFDAWSQQGARHRHPPLLHFTRMEASQHGDPSPGLISFTAVFMLSGDRTPLQAGQRSSTPCSSSRSWKYSVWPSNASESSVGGQLQSLAEANVYSCPGDFPREPETASHSFVLAFFFHRPLMAFPARYVTSFSARPAVARTS